MDTPVPQAPRPPGAGTGAAAPPPARPVASSLPTSLASELRTSVYLLGGALGTMTLLAFTLLLLTHWLAR
jgi:hypothetical protein